MSLFSSSWLSLLDAVSNLSDDDFTLPSGCRGWLVRDLVCHLVIDAQDVLITLATPARTGATHDSITYWKVSDTSPSGDDPLDALVVRLAAAYQDPDLLKFHLGDVGAAADRASRIASPRSLVATQGMVLTVEDFLSAYVLEWTIHHLDLIAHIPHSPMPPAAGLSRSRQMLERITGHDLRTTLSDPEVLRIVTGRQAPTAPQASALGGLADRLPFSLG